MSFEVSSQFETVLGVILLLLFLPYVLMSLLYGNEDGAMKVAFVFVFGTSLATALVAKRFLFKQMTFEENCLVIKPLGFTIPFDAIESVEIPDPEEFRRGRLGRVVFQMKYKKFVWIPLNFLWFNKQAALRVVGLDAKVRFADEIRKLNAKLNPQMD